MLGGGVGLHLAVGSELVDQNRQVGGDEVGGGGGIDTELGGDLLQLAVAKHLADLVGGDRLVLIRADPAGEHFSSTTILELFRKPGNAAVGLEEIVQGGSLVAGNGGHHAANEVIEESHGEGIGQRGCQG